jgi:hypothetical protein
MPLMFSPRNVSLSSSIPAISIDGGEDVHNRGIESPAASALAHCIAVARQVSGIPDAHMRVLHDIALFTKSIVALRPVDPHNTSLIEAGHPTKVLHIKGKSANWGPQYGFICVNQAFSKLRGGDPGKIEQANENVRTCLGEHAEAVELHLSPSRLDYLIKAGLLTRQGGGKQFTLQANPAQASDPVFTGQHLSNGNIRILADGEPVKVLAPPLVPDAEALGMKQLPMTADYDLLAVLPEWEQFGERNIRRPSIQGPSAEAPSPLSVPSLSRKPSVAESAHSFEELSLSPKPGSTRQGLATPSLSRTNSVSSLRSLYEDRSRKSSVASTGLTDYSSRHEQAICSYGNFRLREQYNSTAKTGYATAWKMLHHGADMGNPYSNEADNYPATVFLPRALGEFGPVAILHTPEDLAALVRLATDAGYQFEGNKQWASAALESPVLRRKSTLEQQLIAKLGEEQEGN